MSKIVSPNSVSGFGLSWNLNIFSGPKWWFNCGGCEADFQARVPMNDSTRKSVVCPHCGAVNRFSVSTMLD